MEILYILLSENSFNESLLFTRIQNQLEETDEHYCMSNSLSSCFMDSNPKWNVSLLSEDFEENYDDFRTYIDEGKFSLIVLGDLHEYFLAPEEMNFDLEWLEDLEIPIVALDYFDLLTIQNEKIIFKHSNKINSNIIESLPAIPIKPFIVKTFPKTLNPETQEGILYWDTTLDYYTIVKHATQQLIRDTMQLKDNTKIVTICFDVIQMSDALNQKLIGFYFVVVETIVFYLQELNQNFEVLVIGLKQPKTLINNIDKINLRHFTHLTQDLYQLIVCGSDLLILDSNLTFAHCDALISQTPTMVLGNSIDIQSINEDESKVMSSFSPDPFIYDLINMMLEINKNSQQPPIFPFMNYPNPIEQLPQTGLQLGSPPYHLVDIFDDEKTYEVFNSLLCDQNYLNKYNEIGNKYLESQIEPLKFNELLKRILSISQ